MPLLVHCPNNCQIRVPSNRTGKVVRCADCQTPIWIPALDSPLLRTGNWVECRANRAMKKTDFADRSNNLSDQIVLPTVPNPEERFSQVNQDSPTPPTSICSPQVNLPLNLPRQTARLIRAKPWRIVEPLNRLNPEPKLVSINLELDPSPTMLVEKLENLNTEQESEQKEICDTPPRWPNWLVLVRKLLCLGIRA